MLHPCMRLSLLAFAFPLLACSTSNDEAGDKSGSLEAGVVPTQVASTDAGSPIGPSIIIPVGFDASVSAPAADAGRVASGTDAAMPSDASVSTPLSGDGSVATAPKPSEVAFPKVTDFSKPGPFAAATDGNQGPNGMTVYSPTELGKDGVRHPVLTWMNGGATTQDFYDMLPHLATHGFVVLASNTPPGIGDEVNLGKEMIANLDWALAENTRTGSKFAGKLDTSRIAAFGYSMGSLATFTIANDPRLTTTVHISGGNMAPERVANLRAPAAFICGIPGDSSCNILSGDCDIAGANCATDFTNAKTPVFYAVFPGGHLGILGPPHGERIKTMTTAWMRYQLMGDPELRSAFVGPTCTYCSDTNWKVQQKNLQ
ncbi:MAG: hypothetical protein RL385_4934 [Pseudomonadota bacterium]